MPDKFLRLRAGDRREALAVAAAASGRPVHLLEKDDMNGLRPLVSRRRVDLAKPHTAAESIITNIRHLRKSRTTPTARQAHAHAHADRFRP